LIIKNERTRRTRLQNAIVAKDGAKVKTRDKKLRRGRKGRQGDKDVSITKTGTDKEKKS